jgi:hypothetical protein
MRTIVAGDPKLNGLGPGLLHYIAVHGAPLQGDVRLYRGPGVISEGAPRTFGAELIGTLQAGSPVGTSLKTSTVDFSGRAVQPVIEFDNATDNVEIEFNSIPG